MSRAPFHFKQFSVTAHQTGMAVSTDGVLLGAWCNLESANTILDIGTGTGLLALMCAQRSSSSITAIDIDSLAVESASHNIQHSPWRSRIEVFQADVTRWSSTTSQRFDAIVCNPPYFSTGETARDPKRALARHSDSLEHDELLKACERLLTGEGSASFILPFSEGLQFMQLAEESDWHIARKVEVKTTPNKLVSRLLLELKRQPCEPQNTQLLINEQGQYSQEFINLTRDFYLKL